MHVKLIESLAAYFSLPLVWILQPYIILMKGSEIHRFKWLTTFGRLFRIIARI